VNCGAIPPDLVESELFGHEKGAFTGAAERRAGYFENADGGTLFLDEIGELPLAAQVKLLRALQEGEVRRLGGKEAKKVDVRVIAATNRDLLDQVSGGRFRADLFYRLAVAVIKLPPLRDREGDISLLMDRLLAQINKESDSEPGYKDKVLSPGAKKLLLRHTWPGNVRELLNTLRRAAIWSQAVEIQADDIKDALFPENSSQQAILERPLGDACNLPDILQEVARHYLERAIAESGGNKSIAAKLVGLRSYQTFTNWLTKYRVRVGNARA
jgi:DNA-binding NtrC family response regulator